MEIGTYETGTPYRAHISNDTSGAVWLSIIQKWEMVSIHVAQFIPVWLPED